MNFPQKRNVNVAAVNKRKHDLSHVHIGTTDFGRIKPIECRYMVPGDDFAINVTNETRVLNAMPSPTIGRFDVVYRSFFVPINHIWSAFYDFLKNQQTIVDGVQTNVSSAPYIKLVDLLNYFRDVSKGLCEIVSSPTVVTDYDFVYKDSNANSVYLKFTKQGRIFNDFLTSFGINIPYAAKITDPDVVAMNLYIILPLVAFWKFYFDWIVPSRFIREHQDYIESFISTLNESADDPKVSAANFFKYLCHEPLAYYLDDVFTTSTEYPFSQPDNMQESIIIANPNNRIQGNLYQSVKANFGTDTDSGSVSYPGDGLFNMYTLQTLGKLQDLLNRNLIAGTKVQDWLLTEFGIKPNNDALHLSTYLGSKRTTLNVRDIISNADTEAQGGVALGSYGGYIRDGHKFDFGYKAQDHGFFFITYELVPRTSYYQGLPAQFDMGKRFDFFQPEFDNQQGEPIPFRRLTFSQMKDNNLWRFDTRFGFGLQYNGFKYATDVISGDFRTRFGLQLKSWFLARDVSYIDEINNGIEHVDEEFCLVKSKYQDWHYIFSNMDDELDPFLCAWNIEEYANRPMKSIVEGFEPTYQQSDRNVKLDFSGSVK